MPRKVLYIISNVTDSTEYELLTRNWDRSRIELEFLLYNPVEDCGMQRFLRQNGYSCTTFLYKGKRDTLRVLRQTMRFLRRTRPDVVNTNLLEANFIGLIAAWLTGIGRRTYTRHHSTHNHKYHPIKGVLYDRISNRLAHRIIAITKSTQEVLVEWEHVPQEKVVLIYHGYELHGAHRPDAAKLNALEKKYDVRTEGRQPVIGIISRPFAWKGLDHSIPALKQLLQRFPRLQALFFNWKETPQSAGYDTMLDVFPKGVVRRVQFEPDVVQLFHSFDVFIHVPEDQHAEAFGLVYIESTMAGVPCVFTRSGVMHDLDPTRLKGVIAVPFKDSAAIERAALHWLENPPSPEERQENAEHNARYLASTIDISHRVKVLTELYEQV